MNSANEPDFRSSIRIMSCNARGAKYCKADHGPEEALEVAVLRDLIS
jgi:hypothetical protein